MGHFVGTAVSSATAPQLHAGISYQVQTYTLAETASASVTIAIAKIPGGARILAANLTHDNNALDATGAGSVSLQTWTGGNLTSVPVQTAVASQMEYPFNPLHDGHGIRHTSSSNVVVKLSNFAATGTGTGQTVFTVTIGYDCQLQSDG